ncbi:YeeE/YedE family protein [Kordiimonas sp. SCSIO 12610]|uniref:YeeE/YedE family protein n=1 Tax=Kordiimonas sp. SCSIO 12610 TaxID=2829597 RepID=UPI00210A816A|nr:YeeE/YedE family protein [Kordiimonas sp. SCSIO 12610]UTW54653.1 YeeE/YedE family protein [Kordiimonas sp. SCSIO 12610]
MHQYIAATIGGAMIGIAAIMLMVSNGRVMGVSGIVSNLLPPFSQSWASNNIWRLTFIAGVITAPLFYYLAQGTAPTVVMKTDTIVMIISGLFVGFGTARGGGCTSGHGVCGLARLSRRSIAATAIFMAVAIITVLIVRTFDIG